TAEHFEERTAVWVLDAHKTEHATGGPRGVILTPAMGELTKRLVREDPEGPPFRNQDGKPWARNPICCRVPRVRQKLKLGDDLVASLYRHAVATDLLESGTGIAQAAELLGDRGMEMIMRHSNKLRERRQHLRDEITRATRKDGRNGGIPGHPPQG